MASIYIILEISPASMNALAEYTVTFKAQGLGSRVQGLEFGTEDLGLRVEGLGSRV